MVDCKEVVRDPSGSVEEEEKERMTLNLYQVVKFETFLREA